MTAAIATPTTSNVLPVSSTQEIPLARICEAKTNPRRQFDETKLAELSDNIRLHGKPGGWGTQNRHRATRLVKGCFCHNLDISLGGMTSTFS
jgi:hypothetical protein